MHEYKSILDFLEPVSLLEISEDEGYKHTQIGNSILLNDEYFPELTNANLVIVGFGENRGSFMSLYSNEGPNAIRKEFYALYQWHPDLVIADVGNVRPGSSIFRLLCSTKICSK